jgi:hypothetical protein
MKSFKYDQFDRHQSQQGVALIAALFILVILSIIVIAVLADVQGEIRMSGIARNSERALKLAETGVQVARATIAQGAVSSAIASVDGFVDGGYFFTSLGSGMPGNEKWEQWHYDAGISGNNLMSEITTPLRPVWIKESPGRNGKFDDGNFTLTNIYPIIAGGAYFPIEFSTDTELRAIDEYTGQEGVVFDPENASTFNWTGDSEGDKSNQENINTNIGYNNSYAVLMSPMASYSNLSSIPGQDNPQITLQTIYFTYLGDVSGGSADTSSDTTSTVRLRAINSLCNNSSDTTKANILWEFDTQIHGIGTAPAFFDPSPKQPGDEIIYFAVIGLDGTNLRDKNRIRRKPYRFDEKPEELYVFAVVDETSSHPDNAGLDECNKSGRYRLKWAHPFPDPDVAEWTDYPTEEATATNGMFPPYIRKPSDMTPFLPEDDLLFDYRDSFFSDGMQNQIRGNVYTGFFEPPAISPVVVNPLYELDGTNLDGTKMITTQRKDTIAGVLQDPSDSTSAAYGNPADPLIELYLVYVALPHVKQDMQYSMEYNDTSTRNWGRNYELKKYSSVQTRVIALRDQLDGTCDSDGNPANGYDGKDCVWNWNSAKSRFPVFKWSYRVPARDPSRSDARPWNGYGEFVWDNWFDQQIAPMVGVVDKDQDGTEWGSITDYRGGKRNHYANVYVAYETLSYPDEGGDDTTNGPTTANGAPLNFSGDRWDDNTYMMMALRDTWDDYMEGNQTNPMWDDMVTANNNFAVRVKSSPVEDYWTHKHNGGDADVIAGDKYKICEADGSMVASQYPPEETETVITYSATESTVWQNNTDKIGFARPYVWSEDLWDANVDGSLTRGLTSHGWDGSGVGTNVSSTDMDVEGETSAMCRECLDGDGLIVSVFNHDCKGSSPTIEDLRVHGINATTGFHVWDYHMPATYLGDYFNATPAIANNQVFVAYVLRDPSASRRGAYLRVLDADTGIERDEVYFDYDPSSISPYDSGTAGRADALLLPPTIANGAVYVGTYHFRGSNNQDNDSIRIYAFSPVLRLFSMGIYPMAYTNETTIPDLTAPMGEGYNMPRAERKLQVWITGSGSKWEEILETRE